MDLDRCFYLLVGLVFLMNLLLVKNHILVSLFYLTFRDFDSQMFSHAMINLRSINNYHLIFLLVICMDYRQEPVMLYPVLIFDFDPYG